MYFLFTDFGSNGPYLGQMTAAILVKTPDLPVINLMADAPAFNIQASATLLYAFSQDLPQGAIIIAVVDPGVGSERTGCVIQTALHTFIGPDNGLFDLVVRKSKVEKCWQINSQSFHLSRSFHGRDLFAPLAAMIKTASVPAGVLCNYDYRLKPESIHHREIIYVDGYGNLMTNIFADELKKEHCLKLAGQHISYASVFSSVAEGEGFWYVNSSGLIEIAVNQGSAALHYQAALGDQVEPINPSA